MAPAVAEALGSLWVCGVGRVLIADFTQLADCLEAFVVLLLLLHVGDQRLTALVTHTLIAAGPSQGLAQRADEITHQRPRHGARRIPKLDLSFQGGLPMKAIAIGAFMALGVTAAGAANTKKTTSALDGYTRCLSQTAAKLDDGKADPKTVAVGVAVQCAWKRELAIAEMMKGSDDPDAKQGAAEAVRGAETGIIVGMVLELRKVATRAKRPSGPSAAGKKLTHPQPPSRHRRDKDR